jgi:hypothetical protein
MPYKLLGLRLQQSQSELRKNVGFEKKAALSG